MPNVDKTINDNITTKYEALSAYGRQIVTFRFTLLGFFLAAVGLVVSGVNPSIGEYMLLCFLTLGLYMLELRNRSLLIELDERGIQIEREYWEYVGEKENELFFHVSISQGHATQEYGVKQSNVRYLMEKH